MAILVYFVVMRKAGAAVGTYGTVSKKLTAKEDLKMSDLLRYYQDDSLAARELLVRRVKAYKEMLRTDKELEKVPELQIKNEGIIDNLLHMNQVYPEALENIGSLEEEIEVLGNLDIAGELREKSTILVKHHKTSCWKINVSEEENRAVPVLQQNIAELNSSLIKKSEENTKLMEKLVNLAKAIKQSVFQDDMNAILELALSTRQDK